ncbi:hypothetical protein [Streptomyces sp. NPDC060001]|uniref:hypothetical protein n=1 Tax=Streptomyces sp. NPDC060001 TaxID=3347032 RepID=UPI0036D0AAF1
MADEPSLGELGRLIQALRGDVRDDMAQINSRLDRLVSIDVYAVEKAALLKDLSDLEAAHHQLSAKHDRDIAAVQQQRAQDADKMTQTRRWLAGAVISLLGILVPVILFMAGGKS